MKRFSLLAVNRDVDRTTDQATDRTTIRSPGHLSIHVVFAALALGCLVYCGYQGLRLRHALRIEHAIALLDGAGHATADGKQARGAGTETGTENAPQVQLARAVALARAGANEDAAKLYGLLIRQDRNGRTDAGRTARFDLGNLYLRAGLASRSADPSRSMPMIELAKQRYRDLLNIRPEDWDARYNLERALWAAPETGDESGNIASLQAIKRNALAPGMNAGDLP